MKTVGARWLASLSLRLVGLSVGLTGCVHGPYLHEEHPLVGQAFATKDGALLSEATLAGRLHDFDFILLGEVHDNPRHHEGQARLVKSITGARAEVAVFFEQLTDDQGDALREVLREKNVRPAAIAKAVRWDESGWPDFKHYEPLFAEALAGGATLDPALFPKTSIRAAYQDGIVSVVDKADVEAHSLTASPTS